MFLPGAQVLDSEQVLLHSVDEEGKYSHLEGTYAANEDESLVRQCHNYVMCLLGYLR